MKQYSTLPLLLFALLLLSPLAANAQEGTQFQYNQVDEAISASSPGEYIFVDLFATWCGPCLLMDKEVFPQEQVANYINTHFTTCRLNADSDAGKAFMAQHHIDKLPTLVVIDHQGNLIKAHSGLLDGYGLVRFLREARADLPDMKKLYSQHRKNKNDLELMQAILLEAPYFIQTVTSETQMKKWALRINDIFSLYTQKKGVENMANKTDFHIIANFHNYYEEDDPIINKLVRHFNLFATELGAELVAQFITSTHTPYIVGLAQKCNNKYQPELARITSDMLHVYSVIQNDAENYQATLTDFCKASCALAKKDFSTYTQHMQNYLLALPEITYNDYAVAIEGIYNGLNEKLDNASAQTVITWGEEALQLKPQLEAEAPLTMVLGDAYKQLGNTAKAQELYNRAFQLMMQSQQQQFIQMLQPQITSRLKALNE